MLIINIIEFFMKLGFYVYDGFQYIINTMKHKLFDGYLISYAIYNPTCKTFTWIYNYDKPIIIIWLYIQYYFNILNIKLIPLPLIFDDLIDNKYIIASYLLNKKQKYLMFDNSIAIPGVLYNKIQKINNKYKYIYCILDETYDLTREFEKFKQYILLNKFLTCHDIIKIITLFSCNIVDITKDSILKIMMDDNFNEQLYKDNDILVIHDG